MSGDFRFALHQRATWVWFVLVAATACSWVLGTGGAAAESTRLVTALLVGIALFKARLVIRYFMEVRQAALSLRILTDLWCAIVGVAIIALYWAH